MPSLAATLLLALSVPAQEAPVFERLSPTAFACISSDDSSANGALFVGSEAALLVDPGHTPLIARAFFDAADQLAPVPIRYVALTHWHPDHCLGLAADMGREFTLISHPRTRRALADRGQGMLEMLEPAADLAVHRLLADTLISDRETIDLGGLELEIFHPGPAHTQGDLVVWSPSDRVLVTGDLFLRDSCPDIGGGDVENLIKTLAGLEGLEPKKIVPGHFALSEVGDMRRFRAYLESLVTQMTDGAGGFDNEGFADFLQFPRYGATFADNARAVRAEITQRSQQRDNNTDDGIDMQQACQDEVIELHRFFQQWFAGELANTLEAFARFADVIETDFEIISPSGVRKGRAPLMEDLRGAHGFDPQAKIWIRNFEWREVGSGLYQVTYEEWQRSGDDDRGRLSSALFRGKPGLPHGVEWLHLHEGWLPDSEK